MCVAFSVGMQRMMRSDLASAGITCPGEPETGHANLIYLTGNWGLDENVMRGAVNSNKFYLFKPALRGSHRALITQKLGGKVRTMR